MDTRLLRLFCAVARHGSLVAAAQELHLTASALSHGLKSLESDLGCRLFDRVGKKLRLNQAGEQLLAQVQPPLAALEAAAESIRGLAKWGQTRLRIGAAASACSYLLPAVIRQLKRDHPNATLQVESGDMAEMVELIQRGRLDLALGVAPDNKSGLNLGAAFHDELLFVFAPSHPWAAGRPIPREELRSQPLILYQRSSLTARLVDEHFRSLDLVPSTVMEIGSIEAMKELAKLNLGVAVLAPWTAEKELDRGSLRMRPISARPLRRHWVIASVAGKRLSLVEETFCKLCREVAAGRRLDRRDVPALGSH